LPKGTSTHATDTFPTLESSDFAGEGSFYFDLVRLEDHDDIPREFLHRHNYYHLLWMTEARGTHMLDFEQFDVRDHSVFFLSPGQLHTWTTSVKPRGFVLNFSTDFFAQMFPRVDDIAKFPFFHLTRGAPAIYLTREQHDAMLPLLNEIESESRDRQVGRFDVVRSYLLILLTQLRRLYPADEHGRSSGLSYSLTKRFALLLEENYLSFTTIRQYADTLCISERQLNEALKRTVGNTASRLVQERIALEAKRLLSNTKLSTAQIAFQLNFDDPAYFTRFVKKHTTCTPGEFRKKYSHPSD